jgi:transcriptional regulator with XRE-family HTH domain
LLRRYRLRTGITQRVLADLSTVSVRAIRDLEQGKARRPRQDTVRLIADGLRLGRQARLDLEVAADHRPPSLAEMDPQAVAPPTALTAAIGRDAEAELLTTWLRTGACRLVDVVGLGGTGKTCLAREVADRLHARHGMPVLWIGLATTTTTTTAVPVVDERLRDLLRGCVEELFELAAPGSAIADLAGLVAGQDTLLVLDGVDRRAPREEQVMRLLRDCSGLRILLTGSTPAALPGGRTFMLSPLDTPAEDSADLAAVPSVRLFLDAAARAQPGFAACSAELPVVAEICRLLDGLPTALEAAASWLAVYDLGLLAQVLRGDPVGVFDHLAGTEGGAGVRERLDGCLNALPANERHVLDRLCELPGDVSPGDVVALTGRSLAECGRLLRCLLLAGVLRTGRDGSFRVLNLVRVTTTTPHR